jgi:pantothenate kinase-related protein Tda10
MTGNVMNFLIGKRTAIIAATTAIALAAAAALVRAYKRRHEQKLEARLKQLKLDQEAAAFENRYLKEYDELATLFAERATSV